MRSKQQYLDKANEVHLNYYNYSKTIIGKFYDNVIIICPIHGEFTQVLREHLRGKGCRKCADINTGKLNTTPIQEIIDRLKQSNKHGYAYPFIQEEYQNQASLITGACCKHGQRKRKVARDWVRYNDVNFCTACLKDDFINKSVHKFGAKYTYTKVEYKNSLTQVTITCPIHGDFEITPSRHLVSDTGCRECGFTLRGVSSRMSVEKVEARFKKVHYNKYDYPYIVSEYQTSQSEVTGYCKEHDSFFKIKAGVHSNAKCKGCKECWVYTSVGEAVIKEYLTRHKFKFKQQKTFPDCVYKKRLIFDFFIPSMNVCIEFDGRQHFIGGFNFGSTNKTDTLADTQKRDNIKNKYCEDKGIRLIRIPYTDIEKINNILDRELINTTR